MMAAVVMAATACTSSGPAYPGEAACSDALQVADEAKGDVPASITATLDACDIEHGVITP